MITMKVIAEKAMMITSWGFEKLFFVFLFISVPQILMSEW